MKKSLKLEPGICVGLALGQVTETSDAFVIGLGPDVTKRNVVKVLNHEALHAILQDDPGTWDASEALDSYWINGVEHLYTRYDRFGLPVRNRPKQD